MMPRKTWDEIKRSKRFSVYEYRACILILIVSMALNVFLSVCACVIFLKEPEPDYYATSGITPPVELKVMFNSNKSSVPLLESEPEVNETYQSIS